MVYVNFCITLSGTCLLDDKHVLDYNFFTVLLTMVCLQLLLSLRYEEYSLSRNSLTIVAVYVIVSLAWMHAL